jgi:hypothetical protein
MEPCSAVQDHVLSPTAIYSQITSWDVTLSTDANAKHDWNKSYLNPKNRIESLRPHKDITWRLDGIDSHGTQFFAYPISAVGRPPMRVDVFIPGQQDHPVELRSVLRSGMTVVAKEEQVVGLEICQHLLRALQSWEARTPGFHEAYAQLPFGSRIVVNDIQADVNRMDIVFHQVYTIEQNWLSVEALEKMWCLGSARWPATIDLADLQLHSQPHESISIVRIPARHGPKTLVFKSLLQDTKYMYHELKMLLTLEPHSHIVGRPLYVVKKKCRFGGKFGVCGFVMQHYPLGNLGRRLERYAQEEPNSSISLKDRVQWARQITQAILHISNSPMGFYPDLKPDNIVLTPGVDGTDAVLIDLEQRGGWYSWSPPEVRYVEYLEYIATRVECPPVRKKSLALLNSYIPGWKLLTQVDRYRDCGQGFSDAWLTLELDQREAAQVFMLGKLLWCIFEKSSSINCGIGFDMFREQEGWHCFPEFRHTPLELRECIRSCTEGAPEWDGKFRSIVRRGDRLYAKAPPDQGASLASASPQETQDAAIGWWTEEVRSAKRFMEQKTRSSHAGISDKAGAVRAKVQEQARRRPRLKQILEELDKVSSGTA